VDSILSLSRAACNCLTLWAASFSLPSIAHQGYRAAFHAHARNSGRLFRESCCDGAAPCWGDLLPLWRNCQLRKEIGGNDDQSALVVTTAPEWVPREPDRINILDCANVKYWRPVESVLHHPAQLFKLRLITSSIRGRSHQLLSLGRPHFSSSAATACILSRRRAMCSTFINRRIHPLLNRVTPGAQLQKTHPPNSTGSVGGPVGEQTERSLEKLQVAFKGRWRRYVSSRSPSCSEGPSARPCFPSSLLPRELPYR